MKSLMVSLLSVLSLAVLFVVGASSGQAVLSLIAFCGWTPAVFAVGFLLARSGVRVKLERGRGAVAEKITTPPSVQKRRRVVSDAG